MKRTCHSLHALVTILGLILLLSGCFQLPGDVPIDTVAAPLFVTFVNECDDAELPAIFVFARNVASSSGELTDEVAWRVMPDLAKGASSTFMLLPMSTVQATWGDYNRTSALVAGVGSRYAVVQDDTGIVLLRDGNASQSNAIEVASLVHVDGGIMVQLLNDGKLFMQERVVAYAQKATFIIEPKLYWGIASEIQEGQLVGSADLQTDVFFEQSLAGVSQATITLTGNSQDGYRFEANGN